MTKLITVNRQSTVIPDVPIDGDFIERIFRLTSVGFCPQDGIEFSEDVLREALPLFQPRKDAAGKDAYLIVLANHEHKAGSWLGQVREAWYIPASETMPAGIDGNIRLFRDSDPRIIRGVEAGVVTAGSICFVAEVEQSHEVDNFDSLIGLLAPDGTNYRYIAERIVSVDEFSIVWAGADPTALNLDRAIEEPIGLPIVEEKTIMELSTLIEKLGLAPEATEADILAAMDALLKAVADKEAEVVTAEQAKTEAERAFRSLRAEVLVEKHGIKPESKVALIERATDSYEAVKMALESVPIVTRTAIPAGVKYPDKVGDIEETVVLTAAQENALRQMNGRVSRAQFIKTLAK